jgi:predicted ribosome quality control (RQC) complex YloA/Tae2 family protein
MQIEIFLSKSVEQNAALCYEKAKKAKKKIEGVEKTLAETEKKLAKLLKEKERALLAIDVEAEKIVSRKKEWFEKFHWFYSSEGFLCIGGRDATSNEIIVKKHAESGDWLLHTDMSGSPFFVVKKGLDAGIETLQEAAQATAAYSKAWKLGLSTLDVFYVKPSQVSKKAQPGEFMAKGAFMITGETKYLHPLLEVAVAVVDGKVIGGAVAAVKKQASKYVLVVPGRLKTSDAAKKIKKMIGGDLDEIVAFIPAGGCEVRNS